jgi:hypothetical protein
MMNQRSLYTKEFCLKAERNNKDEAILYVPDNWRCRKWMTCLKQGVCQKMTDKPVPNMWAKTKDEAQTDITKLKAAQEHHPSVDLYRCPVCGAIVCVE